jgi:NAD(P)-dependent dehydrogenase (short-subunit alcohol dehydrogenase family)
MSDTSLLPKTVVVSGAASGIGAAAFKLLKSAGVNVIGVDIQPPAMDCTDRFIQMDQGDFNSIDQAVSQMPSDLGGLLNIAGVAPQANMSASKLLLINFYGLRYFTEKMHGKLHKDAAIVNLSSGSGMGWRENMPLVKQAFKLSDAAAVTEFCEQHQISNQGMANNAAYPLSKQLLIAWTATAFKLWHEYGVRINAVAPAAVSTPILDDFLANFGEESANRMRSIGASTAEEIADIALMLLDSRYKWINGTTIPAERGILNSQAVASLQD